MVDYRVDVQLVDAINQGEDRAFNSLMMRYQPQVLRVVSRYVRNPSDIMDVMQEVFIKMHQNLHNFRGDSAFYTWLYRITINTAKNHIIRQRRHLPYLLLNMENDEKEKFLFKNNAKEQDTPESLLMRNEMEEAILAIIHSFPKDMLTALRLREGEQYSYKQIANKMKCRVGTIKSRIFRARKMIDSKVQNIMLNG